MKEFDYVELQAKALSSWGWNRPTTIRLPNDRASNDTLNGPCHTYRLGRPMELREWEAMPRDLQLRYLRRLRQAGATRDEVWKMLGSDRVNTMGVLFDRPDAQSWAKFLGQC